MSCGHSWKFGRWKFNLVCKWAVFSGGLLLSPAVFAQSGNSIALILDASGSMNAKLPSGEARIDAAKTAVAAFVGKLSPSTRIALRVYGHQSPTKDKNCKDTELMTEFGPASAARETILARARGVKAQGYTPITHVLELAAADVGKEPGRHTVVLVSDGKETCEGDPCAAAKALADADAKLVVHTIGFNVDVAARYQLQCVARVARGTYSDAASAGDLGAKLNEVAEKPAAPPVATAQTQTRPPASSSSQITIARPRPGTLQIKNASRTGHDVIEVATGKNVIQLSSFRGLAEIPAGLYNVTFGPTVWKSVEVRAGETTVLNPGVLEMTNYSFQGNKVLDWETSVEVGELSSLQGLLTVLPSTFTVKFGGVEWNNIEVKEGEHKKLNPAVISMPNASGAGHKVFAEDGALVGDISSFVSRMAVPPGKYVVEIEGQKVPLDLAEGQTMEINLR